MNRHQLDILLARASKLVEKCELLKNNHSGRALQFNLRESFSFCRNENPLKPLVISLIGGTGVGKSFIFSSLAGTPGISPSSASVRGFTCKPYIAANKSDRAFLPFSDNEAEFLPGFLENAILIDTPDLDTINENNARLAQEAIAASDIIICVTTPDKRSDFSINQNILNWASRKRWFFVMNKLDLVEDVPPEILKNDFSQRLRAIGFSPEPSAMFFISARQADSTDFTRLKNAILASHSQNQSLLLRKEACIRSILYAINSDDTVISINKLLGELKNNLDVLGLRLSAATDSILNSASVRKAAQDALLQNIFITALRRPSFFLFPYFFILSRFYHQTSTATLENVVMDNLGQSPDIHNCFTDECRYLEDHNLPFPGHADNHETFIRTTSQKVSGQIERTAQITGENRMVGFYIFLGNLLPAIVLWQAFYRSISNWIAGIWLPSDFFVHAGFIIMAASIPGYLLLAAALKRLSQSLLPAPAAQHNQQFNHMQHAIEALEKLLHDASLLSSECSAAISELKDRLPENTYGITQSDHL